MGHYDWEECDFILPNGKECNKSTYGLRTKCKKHLDRKNIDISEYLVSIGQMRANIKDKATKIKSMESTLNVTIIQQKRDEETLAKVVEQYLRLVTEK